MIIVSDYTRYDLYRKLQCLQELKDASQKLKMSYQQEWVGACNMPSGIKEGGGELTLTQICRLFLVSSHTLRSSFSFSSIN